MSGKEIASILKSLGAEKVEVYSGGVKCRALHREDRNPSLSVFRGRDGNWVVKDHGTGESWSLYSYLLRIGLGADEAREMLGLGQWERREKPKDQPLSWLKRVVDIQRPAPNPHPLSDEAVRKVEEAWTEALSRLGDERLTKYLRERGFSPEKAADLGLGVDAKGNIIIPTFDPDGRPRNLQVRKAKGEPRYYFIFSGHEGGYYMAGELERPSLVQLVEGPLNAASLALIRQVENEAYIGVPGASHGLTEALVERLRQWGAPIIIWVDADDAGRRARERWVETLLAAGFERRNIIIPHEDHGHRDINDILRKDPKPHETIARLLVRSKHVSNKRGVKHLARMALEVGAKSLRGISTALGIHNVRFARMGTAPYAALHSEATAKTLEGLAKEIGKMTGQSWAEVKGDLVVAYAKDNITRAVIDLIAAQTIADPKARKRASEAAKKRLDRRGIKLPWIVGRKVADLISAIRWLIIRHNLTKAGEIWEAARSLLTRMVKAERAKFYSTFGAYLAKIGANLPPALAGAT